MIQYDPEKEYLINVILKSGNTVPSIILLGKDIEENMKGVFSSYPEVRKVVVYDNETKEAVHIYKAAE